MPKRTDIQSILILGAGPIIIGQACEFDHSGVQACKALKAEGYKIVWQAKKRFRNTGRPPKAAWKGQEIFGVELNKMKRNVGH